MSHPEPDRQCQLLQATNGEFTVYAGIDTAAFEGLCHGSHGWISGIPSTVPGAARRLYELIAIEGNLLEARVLWRKLAPLMRLQFQAYHSKGEGGTQHDRSAGGRSAAADPAVAGESSPDARRHAD
jgi:hypothetical protein